MSLAHLERDFTCKLDHPLVTPDSPHYRIPVWPPPDDWPVAIDAAGHVASRVGDPTWRLGAYGETSISFVRGSYVVTSQTGAARVSVKIDQANARLFRLVACWFVWGDRRRISAKTLYGYAYRIKPLFVLCAKAGIVASEISRFPRVSDQLIDHLAPSTASEVLTLLHELWSVREQLGFVLFDEQDMDRLEAALPEHESKQTPYIPPRIWLYQMERLRLFLTDFMVHRKQLGELLHFMHSAYIANAGSISAAYSGTIGNRSPFNKECEGHSGCVYHGPFMEIAARFGVAELLDRWYRPHANAEDDCSGVARLQNYLSMSIFVGHKYLLNLSGMRQLEGFSLRADCLLVERDPKFGEFYLLCGETTKSIQDDDARWVTSESAMLAIDPLTFIAKWRMECAAANTLHPLPVDEISNPFLMSRPREPWANAARTRSGAASSKYFGYSSWQQRYPALFDVRELIVTSEDIRVARLITPSLDPKQYAVSKMWHFHDHQLRRTTAVNMLASDLVGDNSLQYQLHHLRRAQSIYYGQGFSRLRLNRKYAAEYLRTAYEMLRRRIAQLSDERYVSPFGATHKANLLRRINPVASQEPISPREIVSMQKLVGRGEIGPKLTLFGVCMNHEPCPWGGIVNVGHCNGCSEAVADRMKLQTLRDLRRTIKPLIADSPLGSPDRASLELQLKSTEGFIRVLQQ